MDKPSDTVTEAVRHYQKRILKRQAGKPFDIRILLNRTFGSALSIYTRTLDIPTETFTKELDAFAYTVEPHDIAEMYSSQIKLVKADPDKFIFGLHRFYKEVMRKVREERRYFDLAHFMASASKQYYYSRDKRLYDIINAYLDMVLQTTEYFKPSGANLEVNTYGISTSGDLLLGPCPYPYSDLPSMELTNLMEQSNHKMTREAINTYIMKRYQELGIPINSLQEVEIFEQTQRIHVNTACALLPFINEYTYDISPHTAIKTPKLPLLHLRIQSKRTNSELIELLKQRSYVLPTNGTIFTFTDATGELKQILIREILYQGSIYLLYRLDLQTGSYAGYYEPKTGYLYSALIETTSPEPFNNLCSLILNLYASQVLPPDTVFPFDKMFAQDAIPIKVESHKLDGPLINRYLESIGRTKNKEEGGCEWLMAPQRVNMSIHQLQNGKLASEEAQSLALKYGYHLKSNEVLIFPSRSRNMMQYQSFKSLSAISIARRLDESD